MTDIPHIPAGTVLRLAADEWRDGPQTPTPLPADDRTIVVARVYSHAVGGVVWMTGHLPGCALTDCLDPCVEGQVTVTALRRHTDGGQP